MQGEERNKSWPHNLTVPPLRDLVEEDVDPATPFRIQCRQSKEGAALEGPALPLHPAVSGDTLKGTGGTKGQKPKAEYLGRYGTD